MHHIRKFNLLRLLQISCMAVFLSVPLVFADLQISVNDSVRLKAFSHLGVPLHPGSGNNAVSGRLPDGLIASVEEIDASNGWIKISSGTESGWIIKKYIAQVLSSSGTPLTGLSYVVGSWNLEYLKEGKTRGFPENTRGGPSYRARIQEDYETIASMIESIEARIIVLEEVYAKEIEESGERKMRSIEVEKLIGILGSDNYDYEVGKTGGTQHIAILYDKRYVRMNAVCECNIPEEEGFKKNLFDRQPLFAHFTFMHQGQPMNDLVVVGVHLASGQHRTKNHDRAMELLIEELKQARQDEWCIPSDENDILITGDFNANRFDNKVEQFWAVMENNGWDVLGDDGSSYPATRLSGHPLQLRNSKIDYIIVTKDNRGLSGEEITADRATVHTDLVGSDPVSFRRHASDHIPVTINVMVMNDTDQMIN